jgi:hypothetical protein
MKRRHLVAIVDVFTSKIFKGLMYAQKQRGENIKSVKIVLSPQRPDNSLSAAHQRFELLIRIYLRQKKNERYADT